MNKKKDDLTDKLYHTTRELEEVRYLLNHRIKILEEKNSIMLRYLHLILTDPVRKPDSKHGWEALRERDVRDARQALAEVAAVKWSI